MTVCNAASPAYKWYAGTTGRSSPSRPFPATALPPPKGCPCWASARRQTSWGCTASADGCRWSRYNRPPAVYPPLEPEPICGALPNQEGKKFCIADPGKGLVTYNRKEFAEYWVSTRSQGEEKGIAMFIQPTPLFYEQESDTHTDKRSFKFLFGYMRQYRRYFGQILLGALVGCLLQLVFPFLTQAIVDVGIEQRNLNIIYLILLGQLMLTVSRTAVDFIRRWILLHISVRINISLVSDFFINFSEKLYNF